MNGMTQGDVRINEQQPWRATTAKGVFLIQLYKAECGATQIDGEDFAIWWIDKWRDPNPMEEGAWENEALWMQGARHLHLLLQINAPAEAQRLAPFLGIASEDAFMAKADVYENDSEQMEILRAETHYSADEPPYDLSKWQPPLRYRSRRAASETVHARAA